MLSSLLGHQPKILQQRLFDKRFGVDVDRDRRRFYFKDLRRRGGER